MSTNYWVEKDANAFVELPIAGVDFINSSVNAVEKTIPVIDQQ